MCEALPENTKREPDLEAVFTDSGDKGSFDGFEGRSSNNDSNSDVDLVGLDDGDDGDDGSPAPGDTDDEEEAQWTDHLSDFPIPDFTAAPGLTFNLPDNPDPLD